MYINNTIDEYSIICTNEYKRRLKRGVVQWADVLQARTRPHTPIRREQGVAQER